MDEQSASLPKVFTPEELAIHFGWSPRKIREFARQTGACRILGNRMVFTQEDVNALLEALKPPPTSHPILPPSALPNAARGSYADLLKLREKMDKSSKPGRAK
ncbi:MAG: hypothetical protein WA950_00470 [Shinella sp.]|uniref:hypothetical protein n=1 Tax=Shinella sp. TaxID=1870904 RepID=UPI003C7188A2